MEKQLVPAASDRLAIPTRPFSESWLISLRRAVGSQGGTPILMGQLTITPEQRQTIRHKSLTLGARLFAGPDERAMVAVELAKMFAAFPAQGAQETAAARVAAYYETLAGSPVWAVAEARRRIMAREVKLSSTLYAPPPLELAGMVDDVLRPYRDDFRDLDVLLSIATGGEPDPEVKQMVADGFDALAMEFGKPGPRAARHETTADDIRAAGAKHLVGYPRQPVDRVP